MFKPWCEWGIRWNLYPPSFLNNNLLLHVHTYYYNLIPFENIFQLSLLKAECFTVMHVLATTLQVLCPAALVICTPSAVLLKNCLLPLTSPIFSVLISFLILSSEGVEVPVLWIMARSHLMETATPLYFMPSLDLYVMSGLIQVSNYLESIVRMLIYFTSSNLCLYNSLYTPVCIN